MECSFQFNLNALLIHITLDWARIVNYLIHNALYTVHYLSQYYPDLNVTKSPPDNVFQQNNLEILHIHSCIIHALIMDGLVKLFPAPYCD